MDLSLWDSSHDQGYLTSSAYESGNYPEDYLMQYFSFGYGYDILEEDALNEKSCMQVLKIWIDKADEDIVQLEEDILMLRCQLIWDDENWSEQCSAVLREKIDDLDILIQNLTENRINNLWLEIEELPPRLHDLLKPLLENYLAKPKQTETCTVQIPLPSSKASTSKDCKIKEENACTIALKTYERKSKSTELEEREIKHSREKQNTITTEFNASSHTCLNNDLSENFVSKPIIPDERRVSNLIHAESERSPDKSEQADSMVKESSASPCIERVSSRENKEMRNMEEKEDKSDNHSKALPRAGVIQGRHQRQSKVTLAHLKLNETESEISEAVEVDSMKPKTEASSKVRKPRVYRRATKGDVLSVKPSVEIKGINTKLSESSEAVESLETKMKISSRSMNGRTKHIKRPRVELVHQVQEKTRQGIETVAVNHAELISPLKPEGQGPQKKYKKDPEEVHTLTEMNKTPCSMNDRTEHVKPIMELEHQVEVQQRRDIETVAVNLSESIFPLKPDGLGPEKEFKEIPEILQDSLEAAQKDKGPSFTENLMEQKKYGVAEWIITEKKETKLQPNKIHVPGTSLVTATLPQEVRKLSFSPPTTSKKDDLTSSQLKLPKMELDAANIKAEEATDGVENLPLTSFPSVKNGKAKLTCSNLRAIAKARNMRGYYKLKKEDLLKNLGLS